jgi:hypothetical protein
MFDFATVAVRPEMGPRRGIGAKTPSALRSFQLEALEERTLLSAAPILSGQTVSGTLNIGQTDSYTFSANAGDSVVIAYGKTGLPLHNDPLYNAATSLSLYDPGSTLLQNQVGSAVSTSGSTLTRQITTGGTYTVVAAEDGGDDVLNYRLSVVVIPATQHDVTGGKLFDGSTVSRPLAAGDLDVYTFTATAGDNVNIALSKIDQNPQGSYYRAAASLSLYAPNGSLVRNDLGQGFGNTSNAAITTQLSTGGTYTIIAAEDESDDYYTYSLSLSGSGGADDGSGAGGPMTNRDLVAATESGVASNVRIYDVNGTLKREFQPFDPSFIGGTTVASGDVNGDGTPDIIVAAGPGGSTNIRVFDGKNAQPISGPLGSFLAYPGVGGSAAEPTSSFYTLAFQGQVNVASGDINGDGHDDIVVSIAAAGPPHLKVFSGADGSELMSLLVYPGSDDINDPAYFGNSFQGGVRIASGDVTGDGRDDILTAAGPGAGPHVKVYDGVTHDQVKSYWAYDQGYNGGVRVAAGDYNGDGVSEIITAAGIGVGPHVKAINAATGDELASFYAYDPGLLNGIWIASGDLDGDGKAEILTIPGAGAVSNVKIFHGDGGYAPNAISSFFAFDQDYTGGSRIATPSA